MVRLTIWRFPITLQNERTIRSQRNPSCNTIMNVRYYTKDTAMTLTVRLPERVEQDLAEYCVAQGVTKSEAVKRALEAMLRASAKGKADLNDPFIGSDTTSGDVARHTKRLLRERFRGKG